MQPNPTEGQGDPCCRGAPASHFQPSSCAPQKLLSFPRPQTRTSLRLMLEAVNSSAVSFDRERFRVRKRWSSSLSLAVESRVKPGAVGGRRKEYCEIRRSASEWGLERQFRISLRNRGALSEPMFRAPLHSRGPQNLRNKNRYGLSISRIEWRAICTSFASLKEPTVSLGSRQLHVLNVPERGSTLSWANSASTSQNILCKHSMTSAQLHQ